MSGVLAATTTLMVAGRFAAGARPCSLPWAARAVGESGRRLGVCRRGRGRHSSLAGDCARTRSSACPLDRSPQQLLRVGWNWIEWFGDLQSTRRIVLHQRRIDVVVAPSSSRGGSPCTEVERPFSWWMATSPVVKGRVGGADPGRRAIWLAAAARDRHRRRPYLRSAPGACPSGVDRPQASKQLRQRLEVARASWPAAGFVRILAIGSSALASSDRRSPIALPPRCTNWSIAYCSGRGSSWDGITKSHFESLGLVASHSFLDRAQHS
jgi:hypothetical protein